MPDRAQDHVADECAPPLVASVLPPGEGYGPAAVGAIGLMVRRLELGPADTLRQVVLGAGLRGAAFAGAAFERVSLPLLPLRRASRYAWGLGTVLHRLRPDLIEVHNRPGLALDLARRFADTPVSLFLHNDPQTMRGARSARQRRILRRRLAAVVAVSQAVRERFEQGCDGAPGAASGVQPNCIDIASIPESPAERDRLVLFAGRLVAEKGADAFVAACARALPALPGWRAEICGGVHLRPHSPATHYVGRVRSTAAAAGIAMTGYLPHEAVLATMARAAIVVVPSRWEEPFGLTALEAMACGAALVCSPRGNLASLAGGAALLVDPDDETALAAAIGELAGDPALRDALGRAGRARAAAFDCAGAARALRDLRYRLLAHRPSAR